MTNKSSSPAEVHGDLLFRLTQYFKFMKQKKKTNPKQTLMFFLLLLLLLQPPLLQWSVSPSCFLS